MTRSRSFILIAALLVIAGLMISGCGGGGLGGSVGGALGGGGGGKAALTGSTIAITSASGASAGTGSITNGKITLNLSSGLTASDYPLELTVTGGNLVLKGGNKPFLGELKSIVRQSDTTVNLTAFTTLHAYMYKKAKGTTATERYNNAVNSLNNFFKMMGVSVGKTVNFLTDNPYSGTNSVAYETAQQLLAYMCGDSDSTGLKNIGTRLKSFADAYMDGLATGTSGTAVASQMNTFTNAGGTITNPGQISTRLNSNAVKAEIASNVVTAFDNADIDGTGSVPTESEIESAVDVPSGYLTTPMAVDPANDMSGAMVGPAGNTYATGVLTVRDPNWGDMGAGEDIVVAWDDEYDVPSDFCTITGVGTEIANGDTVSSGTDLTFKLPTEANVYEVDLYAANNSDAVLFLTFETLGTDSITVSNVEMQNGGSASSTAGVEFNAATGTRVADIGEGASASIAGKFSADVTAVANGSPAATDFIVNFLAPDGIRFIRDGGNYPNYAVTTTLSATGTTNVACPATTIKTDDVIPAGLEDFGVEVLDEDGNWLVEDYLDDGMYVINADYRDYIAAIEGFKFNNNTDISNANLQLAAAQNFSGTFRTWGSLAGTSGAANADASALYGAPVLEIIPGNAVAGTSGLTSNSGGAYGNTLTTAWVLTGKSSSVASTFAGNDAWYLKPTTGSGKTNNARMWLVIPALDDDDPDVVSDNPVTVTAP